MSAAIPPSQFPPLPWKAKIDPPTHKALLALGLIEEALGDLDGRDTPEYINPDRVLNAYKALALARSLLLDATAALTGGQITMTKENDSGRPGYSGPSTIPTPDSMDDQESTEDEELKKQHPGFSVTCDRCGSRRIELENSLGCSEQSGRWGAIEVVCLDCGARAEIFSND